MIGLFPLMVSVATGAPPGDLVEQVQAAWKSTTAYCGAFVFAAHGTRNMAVSKGRSCVEPAKRILTETEGPLGAVVDIRMKGEAWYYDPARPVVVHLVVKDGATDSGSAPGEGIGEWVELLAKADSFTSLEDIPINGRPHWRVMFPMPENGSEVVLMIDQEYRLPTAMELRKDGRPLLSSGYTDLAMNPDIPDSYFRIRPLFNVPTVEIEWDPSVAPSDAAEQVRVPAGQR
jgi:outer membrane lipoprotein-sorting protein